MPLVYTIDDQRQASIIYPDDNGYLQVKHKSTLVLSCTTNKFELEALNDLSEIEVTCDGDTNLLENNQILYSYDKLTCEEMPQTSLNVTNRLCQPNGNTVIQAGFQTVHHFFTLYSVCFDKKNLNTLYTWFNVSRPFFNHHQKVDRARRFFKEAKVHGELDLNLVYGKSRQVSISLYTITHFT